MYYKTSYKSKLGNIIIAACEDALIGLWIEGQKYEYKTVPKEDIIENDHYFILVETKKWLDDYFNNLKPDIKRLSLSPIGTNFQKDVWQILMEIPYGSVITYNDIAKKIAQKYGMEKMSAQAVGGAVGHNPISIIIPCHRVVGSNGSLTGYAGGIDRKIALLTHEGLDMKTYFVPKKGTAL
jgi:methylated-DNA--[protein]-cysteine S-methyltransferase